ncbi:nucleotidyltransferase domain-containing protein [bacterium]|nr:nucleotidyltransferase domain-containing protein [bacterium]
MEYGLKKEIIEAITQVFLDFKNIDKVVLYGSRAKGNYRTGSDIDITLFGKNLNLHNSVYPLMEALDELYLPYSFDISIFKHIANQDLIEHIKSTGKVFYSK